MTKEHWIFLAGAVAVLFLLFRKKDGRPATVEIIPGEIEVHRKQEAVQGGDVAPPQTGMGPKANWASAHTAKPPISHTPNVKPNVHPRLKSAYSARS